MVEWVKIIADWYADATNGANALLAGVPRYPTHPLPANATIYNEMDHGFVARGFFSESSPMATNAILVYELGEQDEKPVAETEETDATVTIVTAVPLVKSDTAAGVREGKYRLRAASRSLVRLNDTMPYGLVHGIEVIEPVSKRWLSAFAPHEGAQIQTGFAVTYTFRDNQPRG